MNDRTGSCAGSLIAVSFLIGILVVFANLENNLANPFFQKPSFDRSIEPNEPSSWPEPISVEQPSNQFWKFLVPIVLIPFVLVIAGVGIQKYHTRQNREVLPVEYKWVQEPLIYNENEEYPKQASEGSDEENIDGESSHTNMNDFVSLSFGDTTPAILEPTSESLYLEESIVNCDVDTSLPQTNPEVVTYQHLRSMVKPAKENPLEFFLSQRASSILDKLAPKTSPVYKYEIVNIGESAVKARQILRLVITEKVLNALKDQRSKGKEKYLMGAIGYHMMLYADEPLTTDIDFLINDKYLGKPYIQIEENTYHLKQQRVSAKSYHELVSELKEPVLELYLSTHFPEGTLDSYKKHFKTSKLSHQFGIRETTNTNIKKFVESLVDELASCAI